MTAWRAAGRAVAFAATCLVTAAAVGTAQQARAGRIEFDTVHSAALERNSYGDSPDREVAVYLPPSYEANRAARYPVVYLLHGFGGTDRGWIRGYPGGFSIQSAMDSLVAAGAAREMIIVMPNAHNRLGGSFYTNSEAAGNWDDFITTELVAYIDGKYRTLATARSRGLAGHSMGGYGTFYLGFRHAGDVFGAAYALSGCCTQFASSPTPASTQLWDSIARLTSLDALGSLSFYQQVYLALGAAFSPDRDRPPLYMDLPFAERGEQWEAVGPVLERWLAHSPLAMLQADPRIAARLKGLRGFAFDVGAQDQLVAPAQLTTLDSVLTRLGVAHTFEVYEGDHTSRIGTRMITKVLPFFSRTLAFSAARRDSTRHTFR